MYAADAVRGSPNALSSQPSDSHFVFGLRDIATVVGRPNCTNLVVSGYTSNLQAKAYGANFIFKRPTFGALVRSVTHPAAGYNGWSGYEAWDERLGCALIVSDTARPSTLPLNSYIVMFIVVL